MQLVDFLVQAKIATYANGQGANAVLADGAKELVYQDGALTYRDRYYGWDPFIGEEVVLHNGQVIWSMNYYGYLTSQQQPGDAVYRFLQAAMSRVGPLRPYRGPEQYEEGDWRYQDHSQGTPEGFEGVEEIFYRGERVYRLLYHGGRVLPRP